MAGRLRGQTTSSRSPRSPSRPGGSVPAGVPACPRGGTPHAPDRDQRQRPGMMPARPGPPLLGVHPRLPWASVAAGCQAAPRGDDPRRCRPRRFHQRRLPGRRRAAGSVRARPGVLRAGSPRGLGLPRALIRQRAPGDPPSTPQGRGVGVPAVSARGMGLARAPRGRAHPRALSAASTPPGRVSGAPRSPLARGLGVAVHARGPPGTGRPGRAAWWRRAPPGHPVPPTRAAGGATAGGRPQASSPTPQPWGTVAPHAASIARPGAGRMCDRTSSGPWPA